MAKRSLAFAMIYAAVDVVLNRFAFSDGWTIIWPVNGATIAVLLMRPRSEWASILAGVAVGTGVGEYFDGNPLGLEIGQRLLSLLEVLLSALVLPPFSTLEEWLRKPYIFLRLSFALLLGPGVSGILAAILFHRAMGQDYLFAFNNWAIADALGIAATMPLSLSLLSPEMKELFQRRRLSRTLSVLGLALVTAAVIFSVSQYPLLFLLYPALLLVDVLFALPGSSIAVAGVCLIAVFCATNNLGPFGKWPSNLPLTRDMALQIYLGFHILALFPASVLIMERKRLGYELSKANADLRALASRDGLTGIANRRSLDERLSQEWRSAARMRSTLALLMIDIDHFKMLNDLRGHSEGDECLRQVATLFTSLAVRPQDVVARFGGEEFAVLLPSTSLDGARTLAEKMRLAVFDLAIHHPGSAIGRITVSIGVAAIVPTPGANSTALIQLADEALYRAKRGGRNRVEASNAVSSGDRANAIPEVPASET